MIDYETETSEGVKTLYRISKRGDKIPLCTIIQLETRKLLIVDVKECTPYIIDGDKKAIKKDAREVTYILNGDVTVLKKPHISQLSYEIAMQQRRAISEGRGGCDVSMVAIGISDYIATL